MVLMEKLLHKGKFPFRLFMMGKSRADAWQVEKPLAESFTRAVSVRLRP
jgi:hypothetical protein